MIDAAAAICKAFPPDIDFVDGKFIDKYCSTEHPVYGIFYETKKKKLF